MEYLTWILFTAPLLDPFPTIPPPHVCYATSRQASLDYQQCHEARDLVAFFAPHRLEELREMADASYRIWDVWYYAGRLKDGTSFRCESIDEDVARLNALLVGSNHLPLPLSWR